MWNKITRCLHVFVTDAALLRDEHWPIVYDALSHKNQLSIIIITIKNTLS